MTHCMPFRRGTIVTLLLVLLAFGAGGETGYAADQAAVERAIALGANWLEETYNGDTGSGETALRALALFKAKVPVSQPAISEVVANIVTRCEGGEYVSGTHHLYQAGVEVNLLVDIDAVAYRPQIETIVGYLLAQQLPNGGWDYPTGREGGGDTSVTQYALLGLWAGARAGIPIPVSVWDNAMRWHFATQLSDGGFAYLPGTDDGNEGGASSKNLTPAALGSLMIAARHTFPGRADSLEQLLDLRREKTDSGDSKKFGVLENVDLAAPKVNPADGTTEEPTETSVDIEQLKQSVSRAYGWTAARISPTKGDNYFALYYYYTLERVGALLDVEQIGQMNWFHACADYLISQQEEDGSFSVANGSMRDTAFIILFLTRSTAKIIGRTPEVDPIGGGLQKGGRGVKFSMDDDKPKKALGDLDELLNKLSAGGDFTIEEVQEQIVEQVQIGDRNALIERKDLLVQYVEHPDAEIRRTAVWALGRTNDLSLARHLISALDDQDLGVIIEARNALCWLARKPRGLGEADDPFQDLPEDASDEQRASAIAAWHGELVNKWGNWYLEHRPYKDRGDEFEAELLKRIAESG